MKKKKKHLKHMTRLMTRRNSATKGREGLSYGSVTSRHVASRPVSLGLAQPSLFNPRCLWVCVFLLTPSLCDGSPARSQYADCGETAGGVDAAGGLVPRVPDAASAQPAEAGVLRFVRAVAPNGGAVGGQAGGAACARVLGLAQAPCLSSHCQPHARRQRPRRRPQLGRAQPQAPSVHGIALRSLFQRSRGHKHDSVSCTPRRFHSSSGAFKCQSTCCVVESHFHVISETRGDSPSYC